MKKIKRFYKEHRVFTILMSIVIVCMVLIGTVLFQCFYGGKGNDKYGNRLEGIKDVQIADSRLSDFENNIKTDGTVKEAEIKITGKIIYVTLQMNEKVDIEAAKGIATKSLENFSAEEKDFYDFNYTLKKNTGEGIEGYLISGAKNKKSEAIIWNNNRKVTNTNEADPNATEKDE